MIVKKAYNIRLYPNKGQANFINKTIGGCKFAYNLCLKSKKYLYNNYGVSYDPKMALLAEEYPNQLGNIDSQGLCNTYQDLKKAYSNWFNSLSSKNKCKQKAPKFKNTKTKAGSYRNAMIKKDIDKLVQYDNKKFLKESERKIKHLQRELSRKNKGSHNREKARLKLAIAHEKLSNKRNNYLHQLTTKIVKENSIICIEDLNVKGMMKNHNLAKSIADCSFSMIRRMLEYKCKWHNRQLIVINRWSPSSKTCNSCGHIMTEWNLGIREWDCPNCGTHHDRDVNAAKNILDEGMKILDTVGTTGSACEVDSSVVEIQYRSTVKQESPLI